MPETPPQPDTARKMVPEIPFDPTNHHNALGCPYCNPKGLKFVPIDALTTAHKTERAKFDSMKKEIGHVERDIGWQSGRVSGLALAIEIANSSQPDTAPSPLSTGEVKQKASELLFGDKDFLDRPDMAGQMDDKFIYDDGNKNRLVTPNELIAALSQPPATEQIRREVIEECAKVCHELRRKDYSAESEDWIAGTADCARALRALAATEQALAFIQTESKARPGACEQDKPGAHWSDHNENPSTK